MGITSLSYRSNISRDEVFIDEKQASGRIF